MRASMISPSSPEFHFASLEAVNPGNLGLMRVPIPYRRSLTSAIRVFLISFFGIPYFTEKKDTPIGPREKNALPCSRPGARN
jgi:hypothetical protein